MANTIKANKVSGFDECIKTGDYYISEDRERIVYVCPCGCAQLRTVPVKRWNWNGNEDAPTLSPSIQVLDGCKWHGFLTNGEWITV